MAHHKIRRGLTLPIAGEPEQRVDRGKPVSRVAVMAADYVGMKPTMHVEVGDAVRRGQLLFEDKKTPGVRYTSPGEGRVAAVHRGDRRALQSVVVDLAPGDRAGKGGSVRFEAFRNQHPSSLSAEQIRELLVESGEWTALRRRPFCRVPSIDAEPSAIFVTVTDSHPLAPDPAVALEGRSGDFERGLVALGKLTRGPVFVSTPAGFEISLPAGADFRHEEWSGPHPAGTAGLHMHLLHPAGRDREVWWVAYADLVAIGSLFETGELDVARVVALAGPSVERPRLLLTRLGAATDDLVDGELVAGEHRVISGSVLTGRAAQGAALGYLGRRHNLISVLPEDRERRLFGWLAPGLDRHSVTHTFLSALLPGRKIGMTTSKNGSDRAIVPIGTYDRVFPWELPAPVLLRALAVQDVEQAERLGVLELDEEDLGVLSYVCPGKHDYGLYLRQLLTTLEKEG